MLFGHDVNSRNFSFLTQISNFRELYTCTLEEISDRFALVSFIHSLEHFSVPKNALFATHSLLSAESHLFVEVPNAAVNPFDLLVVDHRMHFTRQTLETLSSLAGFRTVCLVDDLISKELTLIGRRAKRRYSTFAHAEHVWQLMLAHISWLQGIVSDAARIADSSRSFGLFGSSVSAIWLKGVLRDRVQFFVDEDPARIGRKILGCPIYAARDVPPRSDVFVPLVPAISAEVVRRIQHLPMVLHTPAPLERGM